MDNISYSTVLVTVKKGSSKIPNKKNIINSMLDDLLIPILIVEAEEFLEEEEILEIKEEGLNPIYLVVVSEYNNLVTC